MFVQRIFRDKKLVAQLAAQHMVADAVDDLALALCQAGDGKHGPVACALLHKHLPQAVWV